LANHQKRAAEQMVSLYMQFITVCTNHYNELLTIIKKNSPHVISLQETHIQSTHNLPTPINYTLITNVATNRFGGVALLVHNSVQHTQHIITSDFEAIAAKIES